MINSDLFDLFTQDNIDKQAKIEYSGGVITNEELFQNSEELKEKLCSKKELRFGCCEASCFKFKVASIMKDLMGEQIKFSIVVDHRENSPLAIGTYKVQSDKLTADRMWRNIVAYDAMYEIINSDVAAWYNNLLPDTNEDTWVTMRTFRTRFLEHFGIEQEPIELINDYAKVERTIEPEQLSGKTVITAICEINGCFGHITREGKFRYIYLPQDIEGLYPSNDLYPADDLFPIEPKTASVGGNGTYIGHPQYESFTCRSINKIQIRQEENDIGKIYPDTPLSDEDNSYIIEDNFLVYGKSSEELLPIAQNILSKITNIRYRPLISADVKGNPCFEVGDPIRISTKYELIETYILERTLKGIQALRDTFSSNGVEKYAEQVNGVHNSIKRLKGKSNVLERTIEETKSTIKNVEKGLQTEITQTSEKIELEAQRAIGQEVELAAAIAVTADSITAEVSRASGAEAALQNDYTAKIKLTADQLSTEITEKTQVWDTGDYTIEFSGYGEPNIPVDFYSYYLDTKTGAFYAGVRAASSEGWVNAAYYEYDKNNDTYIKVDELNKGYGAPKVLKKPLEQYGYVGDIDDDPIPTGVGDVWIALSNVGFGSARYFVYDLAHPEEWRIVGYAELETLPEMSSKITQTAKSIELKVSKGDVTSQLLIEPTDIYLKTGRLRIETDNLEINRDGSSGEILSRNLSQVGVTKETARYIKLNAGGLEGGYGSAAKCKIECSNAGLAFRGARMTFCMDSIYVGTSMNATKTNKAYTGDISYVVAQNGDVTKLSAAVLHVWNGLVLDNTGYQA